MSTSSQLRKNRAQPRAARVIRTCRYRRLTLEWLEDRRLLAFTVRPDLAVIQGTLYYNLLPDNVEVPIANQPVELYKDSGLSGGGAIPNGFDPTDALQDTQWTDVNGLFRFDSLGVGTYFVLSPEEPSGLLTPKPDRIVRTVVVTPEDANGEEGVEIDHFEDRQTLTAKSGDTLPEVHNVVSAPGAIGGYRKISIEAESAIYTINVEVNEASDSMFSYSENASSTGSATAVWDGSDADDSVVVPDGLGGIDFTGGGVQDSILIDINSSNTPAKQTFVVYSDATHASQVSVTIPEFTFDTVQIVPFSEFTEAVDGYPSPADFTNVGAFAFGIRKADGEERFALDHDLHRIWTVGPKTLDAPLPFDVTSQIQLVKLTNGTDNNGPTGPMILVGDPVTWTYLVTNPGNEWIQDVDVVDDQPGVTPAPVLSGAFNIGDVNQNGYLEPGEVWQFAAAGFAVEGQYQNLGTATGAGALSSKSLADTDPDFYHGANSPIDVEKYVSVDGGVTWVDADTPTGPYLSSGLAPRFRFVVTNTGNVPLSNVTLSDNVYGSLTVPGTLAVGGSAQALATGTWSAGQHTNTATATGDFTDSDGNTYTPRDTDDANYYGAAPAIDVEKYVSVDGGVTWVDADTPTGPYLNTGLAPRFRFVVTNTGNVTLSNVSLTDNVYGSLTVPGTLTPGGSAEALATGTWSAGQHTNTATATGSFTDGGGRTQTPSDSDDANYFGAAPAIDVEKYVSVDGGVTWVDADTPTGPYLNTGLAPRFRFVVTNTGNVTLSNVSLTDNVYGSLTVPGTLTPGGSAQALATGTWSAGQHTNTATATGSFTDGGGRTQTPSDRDDANYFGSAPAIDVQKFVSVDGGVTWIDADQPPGPALNHGTDPQFRFVVTNTGNVPLANVDVVDDVYGVIHLDGTLGVGAVAEYFVVGIWAAGQHTNTVTATGSYTDGRQDTETVEDSDEANFFGVERTPMFVLGPEKNPGTPQYVRVVNSETGETLSQFVPYESNYVGGARVALADLNGNGTEEIITAPGRNRAPDVKVFDPLGQEVPGFPSFLGQAASFTGGIQVAIGDVNGDGKLDIITVPSYGAANVRVFYNQYPATPAFTEVPNYMFQAFPVASIGGAVVAAADMGSLAPNGSFTNHLDGRAEIIVATGGGTKAAVSVFDLSGGTPTRVQTFYPFTQLNPKFLGGVSLEVARIDGDAIPDIVAGMGVNGESRIEVWTWNTSNATLALLGAIPDAFTGPSNNAPVNVAAMDTNGDEVADRILAVQGPIGTVGMVQRFDIQVDPAGTPPLTYQRLDPLGGFPGPWFIATSEPTPSGPDPQPAPIAPTPAVVWTNPRDPFDVNAEGLVTPLDALVTISYLNANQGVTALPAQQFTPPRFFDISVDGLITPWDVLLVVNLLNRSAESAGEGEADAAEELAAAMFLQKERSRGLATARYVAALPETRLDQIPSALIPTGIPGSEWYQSAAERSLPCRTLVPQTKDEVALFDLESVIDEIIPQIVSS